MSFESQSGDLNDLKQPKPKEGVQSFIVITRLFRRTSSCQSDGSDHLSYYQHHFQTRRTSCEESGQKCRLERAISVDFNRGA